VLTARSSFQAGCKAKTRVLKQAVWSSARVDGVTEKGKKLFRDLGWEEHRYREGGPRSLFYIGQKEMTAQDVQARLRLDEEVKGRCFRPGASARTADKRYARCA